MQQIFTLNPYKFVPAIENKFFSRVNRFLRFHRLIIWKLEGVRGHEVRGQHHLKESMSAGHSILLAPNHSRTADPIALGFICEDVGVDMYAMASWHLFNQGWVMKQFIRCVGAFSVNREGMDRASIDKAISLLTSAQRPLVIFPEGSTSRTNDRLMPFLDGVSFIARATAKKREKVDGGKTVIHPVAIRYSYQGDIDRSLQPILKNIEERMTWLPNRVPEMLPRLQRIGLALLSMREIEIFGHEQTGSPQERQDALIQQLLSPLEQKWLGGIQTGNSSSRIKNLRTKIFPELTEGKFDAAEKERRFADLRDTYVAHQMACFPLNYLKEYPSVDRIRETVERFEEDMTDKATLHHPLKCIIEIGEAVAVDSQRQRRGEEGDPLMNDIIARLQSMLTALGNESPMYREP